MSAILNEGAPEPRILNGTRRCRCGLKPVVWAEHAPLSGARWGVRCTCGRKVESRVSGQAAVDLWNEQV